MTGKLYGVGVGPERVLDRHHALGREAHLGAIDHRAQRRAVVIAKSEYDRAVLEREDTEAIIEIEGLTPAQRDEKARSRITEILHECCARGGAADKKTAVRA